MSYPTLEEYKEIAKKFAVPVGHPYAGSHCLVGSTLARRHLLRERAGNGEGGAELRFLDNNLVGEEESGRGWQRRAAQLGGLSVCTV